ncbi:uncharacterized protein LOC124937499 [Impatiens glandulifera]|uniref:uncharacterized protein LOC124937499 n=1 Tax=Impatiens glandulifera TaxID=253017 RepID=UPI001FB0EC7E|nr:uncharacterized protein LOC124937499 [Impatiens glandulifera]
MMLSAWNFSKASMRLQYRVFQVSWTRNSSEISCSKDSSNSSFPVRYTPNNKSLKDDEEPTCFTPLKPTKLSKRASLKLEVPSDRNTTVLSKDQNQATFPCTRFDEKTAGIISK